MSDDSALDKLKARIAEAKKTATPTSTKVGKPLNKFGKFFSVGVELISGVVVGVGCGLFIDWAFDISPWGLIFLFILGSAAGMLNVYRTLTIKKKTNSKKDIDV